MHETMSSHESDTFYQSLNNLHKRARAKIDGLSIPLCVAHTSRGILWYNTNGRWTFENGLKIKSIGSDLAIVLQYYAFIIDPRFQEVAGVLFLTGELNYPNDNNDDQEAREYISYNGNLFLERLLSTINKLL